MYFPEGTVLNAYKLYHRNGHDGRFEIVKRIRELNTKLTNSRDLVASGVFDVEDFKIIRKYTEEKIQRLGTDTGFNNRRQKYRRRS